MGNSAVDLSTLLAGSDQAYTRWMAGARIDPDPDQAFFAIFEALNWAVALDDRLTKTPSVVWPPGYPERDYVLGFRYARNAVHHDWADALYVDEGGVFLPTFLPAAFFEWCWRPTLPSTNERGRAKYRAHLAGKPVRFTLEAALQSVLAQRPAKVLQISCITRTYAKL